MNPYEESELEGRDLYCEWCGRPISVTEYLDYDGFCEDCGCWDDSLDEDK